MLPLDLSKPLQTKDGHPVEFVGVSKNPKVPYPVAVVLLDDIETYTLDGAYCKERNMSADIINVPEKIVRWVNVYEETGWPTQQAACNASHNGCIARIRIEFTRGQFDD